jgi:hypothetical protein
LTFILGLGMAKNDGHCANVPVGQQPFRLSTRIPNYPFTSCQGIRNFKYSRGVVYKAKHEVCPQVLAFSVAGSGCS